MSARDRIDSETVDRPACNLIGLLDRSWSRWRHVWSTRRVRWDRYRRNEAVDAAGREGPEVGLALQEEQR